SWTLSSGVAAGGSSAGSARPSVGTTRSDNTTAQPAEPRRTLNRMRRTSAAAMPRRSCARASRFRSDPECRLERAVDAALLVLAVPRAQHASVIAQEQREAEQLLHDIDDAIAIARRLHPA